MVCGALVATFFMQGAAKKDSLEIVVYGGPYKMPLEVYEANKELFVAAYSERILQNPELDQANIEKGVPFTKEDLAKNFEKLFPYSFFICGLILTAAQREGAIVGILISSYILSPEIKNISVRPELWKQGIGSRLLEHLMGGTAGASVLVRKSNIPLVAFFEKHKFFTDQQATDDLVARVKSNPNSSELLKAIIEETEVKRW